MLCGCRSLSTNFLNQLTFNYHTDLLLNAAVAQDMSW